MITLSRKPKAKPKSAAQIEKDLQLRIKLDEIERAARFKREQEEHERDAWRKDVAEIDTTAEKIKALARWQARGRKMIPYIPLMIVNSAALQGQFSWALDHLAVGDPKTITRTFAAMVYAVAVESIALFLQYYANRALKNRDSAGMLYLSAFLVAGLVASINFSHYHVPDRPLWDLNVQATAYAFALCSLISPWLWRIHSRAEAREALKAAGEIDSRGVKLSLSRKVWHPIRSIKVISLSAWTGETNPTKAVEAWESLRSAQAIVQEADDKVRDEAAKRKLALKSQRQPKRVENLNGDLRQHPKYTEAIKLYTESTTGPGKPLSQRDLAKRLGMANRNLARQAIKDVNGSANNGLRTAP
jgi:hypothetical protein